MPTPTPTTYLLNTAILTDYGTWRFEGPIAPADARAALAGVFRSAVGHEAAARFLEQMLRVPVPVQRIAITMEPGDRAVVLRLQGRLAESRVLTDTEMAALPFELGLLTRLS